MYEDYTRAKVLKFESHFPFPHLPVPSLQFSSHTHGILLLVWHCWHGVLRWSSLPWLLQVSAGYPPSFAFGRRLSNIFEITVFTTS